ncbi:MAG: TIGR02710 family CRISPR-associated CARF protein [Candidatus Bathyarchaeia archaeon]
MTQGLICTVGMEPAPIIYAIEKIRPRFIFFICSHTSKRKIDNVLKSAKDIEEVEYDFGIIDETSSAQVMRQILRAREWMLGKGVPAEEITVDSTGGTKPMTAGAMMSAALLGLRNVYISVETTLEGEKKPGTMRIIQIEDPQEIFGVYEVKIAIDQFNKGNYTLAEYIFTRLQDSMVNVRKRILMRAFREISIGLNLWDRFNHEDAIRHLQSGRLELSDLARDLMSQPLEDLKKMFERDKVLSLLSSKEPKLNKVLDLLENARRRIQIGLYDDATARLYRTIEAVAQYRLQTHYEMTAEKLKEIGGLSNLYLDLSQRGDPLGRMYDRERSKIQGLIEVRNTSILAHGWEPVKKQATEKLFNLTEDLVRSLFALEKRDYEGEKGMIQHPKIDSEMILKVMQSMR